VLLVGLYDWEKNIQQGCVCLIWRNGSTTIEWRMQKNPNDLAKTLDYEAISNFILAFCG